MKRLLFYSLLVISQFVQAQKTTRGFHVEKPINMAAILASKPALGMGFSSVSEARTIITDIMDVVNIQQNFTVTSTSQVDNAAAVIYQNQRYILYNPNFINKLDNVANDKWASISVLAHEIGHHLLGHTLDGKGSQIPKELSADEFSGLVLHRMGASLQQAQLAMRLISSPYASATHPGQQDRLAAISKGWNGTTQVNNTNRDVAIENPGSERKTDYPANQKYPSRTQGRRQVENQRQSYPQQRGSQTNRGNNQQTRQNSTAQNIIYDVMFAGENRSQYYITAQNNIVKYSGSRMQVVAKIASSNSAKYPYIIYDDQVQLLVDRKGTIYTETGRNVGTITPHV